MKRFLEFGGKLGLSNTGKKRPYSKALATGSISLSLYVALFLNQESVNDYFTRGGAYAVLPIAAAFIFSIVHGMFTDYFWTSLGVEASKKKAGGAKTK